MRGDLPKVLDTETLQSQVTKAAKKRLSLSGLEVLHGRLFLFLRFELRDECSEMRGDGSCESVVLDL
jgi:hypothetical protein